MIFLYSEADADLLLKSCVITRVNCFTSGKSFFIAGAIGGEQVELLCLSPGKLNEVVTR